LGQYTPAGFLLPALPFTSPAFSAIAAFNRLAAFAWASAWAPLVPVQEGSNGQCFFPQLLHIGTAFLAEASSRTDSTAFVDGFALRGLISIWDGAIYRVWLFLSVFLEVISNFFSITTKNWHYIRL